MSDIRIATARFYLRPLVVDDVTESYVGWLRDEMARRYIDSATASTTVSSVRDYVRSRVGREDILFLGIFEAANHRHIGNIKFEPVDRTSGAALMGMLIGDGAWRGKGVAAEVLDACGEWLRIHRSVSRIVLGVEKANTSAIGAYEKAGFRRIDSHPIHHVSPDSILMARGLQAARRLALGTVQFGLPYGIANRDGQVSMTEAKAIVATARQSGLDTLQTAIGYGDSEERLGQIGVSEWHIVSKVPAIPAATANPRSWLEESVAGSLRRLRVQRLDTLLLHRGADLLEQHGEELWAGLQSLRDRGVIGKIGVSIYDPSELDALIPRFAIGHIQAPYNIIDRRLASSGWLQRLHAANVEVHVRSVLLQGLLAMRRDQRPAWTDRWSAIWSRWDTWRAESERGALEACIGFALASPEIDRVLIGVDTAAQLHEAITAAGAAPMSVPDSLACDDLQLVNPMHWPAR